ncbi:MAG: Spy/CpxP family protein refolding chaperone [Pyrinomonadaceae bacterium]
MSLKNKFFSILTVALSVVMFSAFVIAQDTTRPEKAEKRAKGERGMGRGGFDQKGFEGRRGGRGMREGFRRGLHGAKGINLTDAQKEQINAIREANKPDQASFEEMRSLMQAKRAGTLTDEQKARAKSLMEQRKSNAKAVHEQIQNILTAEQKAQIDQKKQEMKSRMQERMQNRKQRMGKPTSDKPVSN